MPCNKIIKPLVVYRFLGKVMMSIITLHKIKVNIDVFTPKLQFLSIPDKKRNAPLRTVQLSGKSQMIGQFNLYQCKGMSVTATSHMFCNQVSKLC